MDNLYEKGNVTPEAVIDRLRNQYLPQVASDPTLTRSIDDCICESVEQLWEGRVKIFIPVLAHRRVRACIEHGSCDDIRGSERW